MNKLISFVTTSVIMLTAFVTVALYTGGETVHAQMNATAAAGANMTNATAAAGANMTK